MLHGICIKYGEGNSIIFRWTHMEGQRKQIVWCIICSIFVNETNSSLFFFSHSYLFLLLPIYTAHVVDVYYRYLYVFNNTRFRGVGIYRPCPAVIETYEAVWFYCILQKIDIIWERKIFSQNYSAAVYYLLGGYNIKRRYITMIIYTCCSIKTSYFLYPTATFL